MAEKVAVLCWEESRPWVSSLRQAGYSVPWVEEPTGDVARQVSTTPPDLLLVDLTRQPEEGAATVSALASARALAQIPVVLVVADGAAPDGLADKIDRLVLTTPGSLVASVRQALDEA